MFTNLQAPTQASMERWLTDITGTVKRSKSSHLQFENDSITFPLQNHQVSKFKRLRNEADDLDSFPKFASTVSDAERGDIDGLSI